METEIWPNLIQACVDCGVPVYLVNARMSQKSARGYRRTGALARVALSNFAHIAAQTDRDAQRLRELGANRVTIAGNLKFDRRAPPEMLELGATLRALFGPHRPVLLVASTREGEEARILDALSGADVPGLLTVIVPRHPQRFAEVEELITRRGFKLQRRSEHQPIAADTRIVLGDSMGEMFAYYAACEIAFIGGSLLPLGGQNLLEACAVGRPVIVGPHTFNFEDATLQAIEAGAAVRVADAGELITEAGALLRDPDRCRVMSEAGKRFTEAHRGATARTLDLIRWEHSSRNVP